MSNATNPFILTPPDTDGDVGPNHYVQIVNVQYQIFDKSGNSLYGPADNNTMWSGFGGLCETNNDGDPIVLYDHLADRWFFSQFALGNNDFHQCIAVSTTGDPTGQWYRYDYLVSQTKMNDYPKFGVWPDGYYMSCNQFASEFEGVGIMVFQRDKMLQGYPAQAVYWDTPDESLWSMLPSNLDGPPPPDGTPNYFVQIEDDGWGDPYTQDALGIWQCSVDWTTPANSTFTYLATLPTAAFDADMCDYERDCIPQPSTSTTLDAISDRLMYLLQYRDFGSYQTLVTNHTVDATGSDQAGIRWYELRDSGSGWAIHQQGTYAGDGTNEDHRWMGSIAMDGEGDIALGYSVSGTATYPSVRYVGRLPGDTLGTLPQGEATMVDGAGTQTDSNRWGDYSAMSVDPVDDCTFWYTQEYYGDGASGIDWSTRIGAFKFDSCESPGSGVLAGTVTDAVTSDPVANAKVDADGYTAFTDSNGYYRFPHLLPGSYDVSCSVYGYSPQTATGVSVIDSATTTQNFSLTRSPMVTVSGSVTDAGTGWPLYAVIDIQADEFQSTAYSDPVSGNYSVSLVSNTDYYFKVDALYDGYDSENRTITTGTGPSTEDFQLNGNCGAPGYVEIVVFPLETFGSSPCGSSPSGWTVIDNVGVGNQWRFDNPGERGNLTGGEDCFAIADSDYAGSGTTMDTELRTPSINCSAYDDVTLEFKYDFYYWEEEAYVDVSTDGGTTWSNVWHRNYDDPGPQTAQVDISAQAANQADVIVRFHYVAPGWDWWWQVDDVRLLSCGPPTSGGLVVGHVFDGYTGSGLNDALIDGGGGNTTTSFSIENDGFYSLYLPSSTTVSANRAYYGTDTQSVTIADLDTVEQDFSLPSGRLSTDPGELEVYLNPDTTTARLETLLNAGDWKANFEFLEIDSPVPNGKTPAIQYPPASIAYWDETEAASRKKPVDRKLKSDSNYRNANSLRTWGTGAAIPTGARYRAAGTTCDCGTYYIFGGGEDSGGFLAESWSYDPSTDTWTSLADMPVALMNMEAECIDGLVYLVGGYTASGNHTNNFLIYDTFNNCWTSATWPNARTPMLAAYGGKLYAFGGNPGPSDETWVYDPQTTTWSQLSNMPAAVAYGSGISAGDYIFSIGGGLTNAIYRYDPLTDTWDASGPQLQDARMSALAAWYGDLIYVVSGGGSGGDIWTAWTTTEVYDPGLWPSGTWAYDDETISTPLVAMAGACAQNKIWGAGGTDLGTSYDLNQFLDGGGTCPGSDIPWLDETPVSGTVLSHDSTNTEFNFSAAGYGVGTYEGRVRVKSDTPGDPLYIPVTMNVVSEDLSVKIPYTPDTYSAYFPMIETAYHNAKSDDQILCQEQNFTEDLTFNKAVDVELRGGYDSGFSTVQGQTGIDSLTIEDGAVTVYDMSIQ